MNLRVFRKLCAHRLRMRTLTTTDGTPQPHPTPSPGTQQPNPPWSRLEKLTGGIVFIGGLALFSIPWDRTLKVYLSVLKLWRPFTKTDDTIKQPIRRTEELDQIRERFAMDDQRTTIITGQYQVGKSWLVEEVLDGQRGILTVEVTNPEWKMELFKRVGVEDLHEFEKALVRARTILGFRPLIVIDIPRNPATSMEGVSTFCKHLVTNSKVARVAIVASQLSIALGFDAGGEQRQANLWIGGLSETQAVEYISECRPGLTQAEAEQIVGQVGSTFGNLQSVVQNMKGSFKKDPMTCDEALASHLKKCKATVERLSTTQVDVYGKQYAVGNIIMDALLKPEGESCDPQLNLLGITAQKAATAINQQQAHAVSYNTDTELWHFSSEMHKLAARQNRA